MSLPHAPLFVFALTSHLNGVKQTTCHILCNDRNQQFARPITREHCLWLAEIAAQALTLSYFNDTSNGPRPNALISRG